MGFSELFFINCYGIIWNLFVKCVPIVFSSHRCHVNSLWCMLRNVIYRDHCINIGCVNILLPFWLFQKQHHLIAIIFLKNNIIVKNQEFNYHFFQTKSLFIFSQWSNCLQPEISSYPKVFFLPWSFISLFYLIVSYKINQYINIHV